MEFTFLIATHMLLCFGFVSKTVLVGILAFTELCLHSTEAFAFSPFCLLLPKQAGRLGVGKKVGRDTPEQLIQNGQ